MRSLLPKSGPPWGNSGDVPSDQRGSFPVTPDLPGAGLQHLSVDPAPQNQTLGLQRPCHRNATQVKCRTRGVFTRICFPACSPGLQSLLQPPDKFEMRGPHCELPRSCDSASNKRKASIASSYLPTEQLSEVFSFCTKKGALTDKVPGFAFLLYIFCIFSLS